MKTATSSVPSQGLPALIDGIKKLQELTHGVKDWCKSDVIVTNGAIDAVCKIAEMTLAEGKGLVLERYLYAGCLSIFAPFQPNFILVEADEYGLRPDSLQASLAAATCKPSMLYLNPTGCNPTGSVLSVERRKRIYTIAREHDLLILEDDPYYYINFTEESSLPSMLSLDVDGRVLRVDSFSKILSAGMRIGYVTGAKELIERINLHIQVSRKSLI